MLTLLMVLYKLMGIVSHVLQWKASVQSSNEQQGLYIHLQVCIEIQSELMQVQAMLCAGSSGASNGLKCCAQVYCHSAKVLDLDGTDRASLLTLLIHRLPSIGFCCLRIR